MNIYIPKLIDVTGDPEKIKYTYQHIKALAEEKPDVLMAYTDNDGNNKLSFQNQTQDANLNLTIYTSIDPRIKLHSCTYSTAAALCNVLGIGTERNCDEALKFIKNGRNSLIDLLALYPPITYLQMFNGNLDYDSDNNIYYYIMDSISDKDKLFSQSLDFRFIYMDPSLMKPLMIEPYDKIKTIDGSDVIIYGDVPPDQIRYRDDMLASIFNTYAIAVYYSTAKLANPSYNYRNCALIFRRAFHMATSIGAKSWIYLNLEELKNCCEETRADDLICAVYSEFTDIMNVINERERQKNRNNQPLAKPQAQPQPPIQNNAPSTPAESNSSAKEMMKNYLAVIYQNEAQKYRLSQQILSLSNIQKDKKNSVKPFWENTSLYDIYDKRITEQELFNKNKAEFEKWRMSYIHGKKNALLQEEQQDFYNATKVRLNEMLQETAGVLSSLYKYNIIPQKYQTLIAISTLFEYFNNGRVDSMKEAINLFEQELRQQLIVDSVQNLSDIVSQMGNSIVRNQQMLYSAIADTNSSIQKLNNEISMLSESYIRNTNRTQDLMKKSLAQSSVIANDTASIKDSVRWIELNDYYFSQL